MRKRSLTAVVVMLILAGACGDGPPPGEAAPETDTTLAGAEPEAAGRIMLYTSVPEDIANDLKAAFEEANPDITVDVFRGTTGDVEARIATEQQGGGLQADLIWVAEPSSYEAFKEDGLLAPYSPPEGIPEEFLDPESFYVAGRVINMIVAWNTEAVPEGLTDWEDLLRPDLRAAFPAPSSGAALAAIDAITRNLDEGFFSTFAENGGVQVQSNGAARDAVIAGEFPAAGVLDYMIRQAKAEGSPVELAYPASGTVVIPSPIAITAQTSNPEGARAFVDYLLSAEGQRVVVEVGGFYPVRPDVDPPEGAPPLDSVEALPVDWQGLVERAEEINTMWSDIFGG